MGVISIATNYYRPVFNKILEGIHLTSVVTLKNVCHTKRSTPLYYITIKNMKLIYLLDLKKTALDFKITLYLAHIVV